MIHKSFKRFIEIASIVVFLATNGKTQFVRPGGYFDSCPGLAGPAVDPVFSGELNTRPPLSGLAALQKNTNCFSIRGANFEADTAHYQFIDTNYVNFKWWPSFVGGDIFLAVDAFGLHLSNPTPMTSAVGLGAEVRVGPCFLGVSRGISENDGLSSGLELYYDYVSAYGGASVGNYRIETGGAWTLNTAHSSFGYTILFLGVNRRFGGIVFLEPEIRIMLPVVSRLSYIIDNDGYGPPDYYEATKHYHFRDMFFAFSVKVGFGFN